MKLLPLFCFLLTCFLAVSVSPARVPQVKASDEMQLSESVAIVVNCTIASVATGSSVTSSNASFVHFPSGVNLDNPNLTNVTLIMVIFSTAQSSLIYLFQDTDATTAKTIADEFLDSMSNAFSTNFVWFSTGTIDNLTNITYTAPGKLDLPMYVEDLISRCLVLDLEGFSLTFVPMSQEPGAYAAVAAVKDVGSFNWEYSMMTGYMTTMTEGSGEHLVDVLDLLNVDSLGPSKYTEAPEIGYSSMVILSIFSDLPVSYVTSEPGTTTNPMERGWFMLPYQPPNSLQAIFHFGLSSLPQSPLSLTFSGLVVPEFTTTALLVLFLVLAAMTLIARKRFSK